MADGGGKPRIVDGDTLAYRKYSRHYIRAKEIARNNYWGIWRYRFKPQWDRRKDRRKHCKSK